MNKIPTADTYEKQLEIMQQFASEQIALAHQLQINITNAKTHAKRAYFDKKMKKVRHDVQQVLSTMEIMKMTRPKEDHAAPTTT